MLDEKASDNFHWKNKLGELESLPGETFNSEAAWAKLHGRMQGKTRSKHTLKYWLAAALFFLALLTPWLFLINKKENTVVNGKPVETQTQTQTVSAPVTKNAEEDGITRSSVLVEQKLRALPINKGHTINSSFKRGVSRLPNIQHKKDSETFAVQAITINTAAPVDAPTSIAVSIPETKKLKVVHINDLGDAATETPTLPKSYEHRSLVKFINREINVTTPASGNTGFTIFKTKNIPSN